MVMIELERVPSLEEVETGLSNILKYRLAGTLLPHDVWVKWVVLLVPGAVKQDDRHVAT
jgi:hypothetical protein